MGNPTLGLFEQERNGKEIIMKRQSALSYLTVLLILFTSMLGCDKKEDTSSVENETPSEPTITAPEQETSAQSISPSLEQFLETTPPTVKVTAGYQIGGIFEMWEAMLHHKSMDIYFEVEAEGDIQKDHEWKGKTYREILDEYCQDNGLVWKITKPNTIRVEKKTM